VTVTAVLVKAQTPRPATITQGDPQRVIWETTAYLQTPYPVEKQTLKVQRQLMFCWMHQGWNSSSAQPSAHIRSQHTPCLRRALHHGCSCKQAWSCSQRQGPLRQ